jgi:putative intracellular protease/amidase
MARVLFILTAAETLALRDGECLQTGFWAQEFVPVWHALTEFGHECRVATPGGRPAALDALCFAPEFHDHDPGRIANLREQLDGIEDWRTPLSLERLSLTGETWDALFFPGGHGPLADLADSAACGNLVKRSLSRGGLLGAVCHGAAGLLPAMHAGGWLLAGRRMTCFSPQEECIAGLADKLVWSLPERLAAHGAKLEYALPGTACVVIDAPLYTGQNPASVTRLAFELGRALKHRGRLDKAACGTPCD